MAVAHRAQRTSKSRPRQFTGKCDDCRRPICAEHAYSYTDESNASITNNAPLLCAECYEKRYDVKPPTATDAYKRRMVDMLDRLSQTANNSPLSKQQLVLNIKQYIERM